MAGNEELNQVEHDLQETELSEMQLDAVAGGTKKDNLNEISTQDMQTLQKAMEQKSQLEQTISNTIKSNGDVLNSLGSNLKAG